jgi:hypothetical protein
LNEGQYKYIFVEENKKAYIIYIKERHVQNMSKIEFVGFYIVQEYRLVDEDDVKKYKTKLK